MRTWGSSRSRRRRGQRPAGPTRRASALATSCSCPARGRSTPRRAQVVGETIEEQTRRTLENVKAILEAAGASMADVVKATVHLSDLALFDRYNGVYAEFFPDPKPTRTTVGSQLLGIMVEIDVIAYVGT